MTGSETGAVALTAQIVQVMAWLAAIPHVLLAAAFVLVGLLTTGLVAWAAIRCSRPCRPAWIAIAVTCALWTAGYTGLTLGLPTWWVWAVIHPLSLICVGVGILAFPGVRRPISAWPTVVLDGWMSVGGVVVVAWLVFQPVMAATGQRIQVPMLVWAGIDIAVASALTGLLVRAPSRARWSMGFVACAATLASVGDLNLALTGQREPTTLVWMVVTLMVGLCPVIGGPDLFLNTFTDEHASRIIRLSQLPLIPAVIFLFAPLEHSLLVNLMAGTVLTIAFGNIAAHSKQNAALLDRMALQRGQFEAVLSSSQDAIMQLAADGSIEFANPAASRMLGWTTDELFGRKVLDLLHPDDIDRVRHEWEPMYEGSDSVRIEFRLRDAAGQHRFMESTVGQRRDHAGGWVLSTRDVTASVALRSRLAQQARTDALTGLLNRAALRTLIDDELARSGWATVFFIDLDEFKSVNDTLGHAAGDDVLIQVARRLTAAMGHADGIARLGGDEFAILVPASDLRDRRETAAALLAAVGQVRTPEHLRAGRASIGIVSGPSGSADDLLRDADLAMYQAKAAGGDVAVEFEPVMRERMLERSRLRGRLENAISGGALTLALQPVVDLGTEGWQGFEALVRWQDDAELRMPDQFLPLAEESGLIVPLGSWVLQTSLELLAEWDRTAAQQPGSDPAQRDPLTIAVNVSPRQLEAAGFAEEVFAALATTGIAPHRLVLEITEQTAVQDFGSTVSHLALLRASGVAVAIDDFGTGYSSLRYLTRLPVDALKIDRQFVSGLGIRAEDEVLVTSMLRLAADLGLDVIAEGVETHQQAALLRGHGCVLAQGYLFSRPIPMRQLLPGFAAGPGAAGPNRSTAPVQTV